MALQLNNVLVPSDDLAGSIQFFCDLLGLELRHSGPTFAWLRSGSTNLMLIAASDARPVSKEAGIYLEFRTDDLATIQAALRDDDGGCGDIREWEQNDVRYLSLLEPGGNLVHVIQPT